MRRFFTMAAQRTLFENKWGIMTFPCYLSMIMEKSEEGRWEMIYRRLGMLTICILLGANAAMSRNLEIYFIDVLGGAATLIATPDGETVLIDSGWMTDDRRDAKRIYDAVVNRAQLAQIDYCITTHWHRDHFGAILPLSELVPILNFLDRGIDENFAEDPQQYPIQMEAYKKASKGQSKVLKAGDIIPLKYDANGPQLKLVCVASKQEIINIDGLDNPECAAAQDRPRVQDDNPNSIAVLLSYGDFQFFCGGDITWMVEKDLVCPKNKLGEIDLYMVDHHGFDLSNNPVFLKSIKPTCAVICNGPRKGASPQVIKDLRALPDCKALYQIHWNIDIPIKDNADPDFIANLNPNQSGQYIKARVSPDAKSFVMTLGENEQPKEFLSK